MDGNIGLKIALWVKRTGFDRMRVEFAMFGSSKDMKTRLWSQPMLWSQPRGVHLRRRWCCGRSREDMKGRKKTRGGCCDRSPSCGRSPLSTQNLMTWRRIFLRATRLPFEGIYIPHFRVDFERRIALEKAQE